MSTHEITEAPHPLRVASVDALRGLAMMIMALDHIREFFHAGAMSFQPEDLTRTTTLLFLTRWITHFCAPIFMFTAGLAAYFWWRRRQSIKAISLFLWKRGVWLIVLDLTVLRFALFFSLLSGIVILNVLWALGWSMVILGFLVHLPFRLLAVLSLAMIALHNLADPIAAPAFGAYAWVWHILHQPGIFMIGSVPVLAAYPLVPWIAVMALGFCFGQIFTLDEAVRKTRMFVLGASATIAFLALRAWNVYGDPQQWSMEPAGIAVLSFLRTTKYPPSLDFLLMTLGPAILLLAWFEGKQRAASSPLMVFGRTPLFFFIVHLYLIHMLSFPLALLMYGEAGFLLNPLPSLGGAPGPYPVNYGYPLWVVYALWVCVLAMLYPVCSWFARWKNRKKSWWLSYI